MTELIHRQLFELFIMFYCGMAMMMIIEARNKCMKIFGKTSRLSLAIYFGSWLCVAFLFSQFLYRCAYGVLSIHGMIAAAVGIVLWKKVIYGIIDAGNEYEKKEKSKSK